MKKYLFFTGLFAVLTFNGAQAQSYYYEDDGYYDDQPVQYVEVVPVKRESKHYKKISSKDISKQPQSYTEANKHDTKLILGIDGIATRIGFKKEANYDGVDFYPKKAFKKSYKSFGLTLGIKPHDELSIEAFMNISGTETKDVEDVKISAEYAAIGADLIMYTHASQEFDILFSLGLAEYFFHYKVGTNYPLLSITKNEDSLGARVGLGFQYNLDNNWAVRFMGRYIPLLSSDYVKNLAEFSLGLRYMF